MRSEFAITRCGAVAGHIRRGCFTECVHLMCCPKVTGKLLGVFPWGTGHLASGPMRGKAEPRKPCQHSATLLRRQGLEIGKLSSDFATLSGEAPVIFFDLLQE